jgi:hypothetical protein
MTVRNLGFGSQFTADELDGHWRDAAHPQPLQPPKLPPLAGMRGETAMPLPALRNFMEYVTGHGRREPGIPDLAEAWARKGLWAAPFIPALAATDKGKLNIFLKHFPGTPHGEDRYGNPIVYLDGQETYLDAPGMSPQDVYDTLTGVGFTGVAAALDRLGGGARSWSARRGLTAGGGAAVGDIARYELGRRAGSREEWDPNRTLLEFIKKAVTGGR